MEIEAQDLIVAPFADTRTEWAQLIKESRSACLYHSPAWLNTLQSAYKFKFSVALLRNGDQPVAGCLFAQSKIPFVRRWVALPFSDSCEPLAEDANASTLLLERLATARGSDAYEIRGVRAASPWVTTDCFVNWRLAVASSPDRLYQSLAANFRRNVNRARKFGVGIESGSGPEFIQRFCDLNLRTRHRLGLPSQPSKFFLAVGQQFGLTNHLEIWLASRHCRDLAAVVLIKDSDRFYYKWSARSDGDTMGAGHLLVWSIVESIAGKVPTLDLGRSDIRNLGLTRFKRELGAISVPLPSSFLPEAPNTISSEHLSGMLASMAHLWRRLPRPVYEPLSRWIYQYLA